MHILPVWNTGYDFLNKVLFTSLQEKPLISYVDFLASKSNCVISSVEDARKLEDLKIISQKAPFPTPDGEKLL